MEKRRLKQRKEKKFGMEEERRRRREVGFIFHRRSREGGIEDCNIWRLHVFFLKLCTLKVHPGVMLYGAPFHVFPYMWGANMKERLSSDNHSFSIDSIY